MANVLFLLHGVGEHPEKWEQSTVGQLRTFCDKYSRAGEGDFDKRFKPIGISYSGLFRDILTEWATRKADIEKLTEKVGADLVEKLLGWIAGAEQIDTKFFWTHTFDVLTYRLLPTVRDAVKVRVASQIHEGIKNLGATAHWSIIAHSLGTAVIHDTLQAWYTQPLAGGGTLGQHRVPRLVQMVANCSRVLQTSFDAYLSDVMPGKACHYYFTVQHPSDPVTLVRPFLPTKWPPQAGPNVQKRYYQKTIEHDYIQQKNIHDLGHYLRHPEVVIPLFRCLTYDSYLGQENERNYRKQFKLHGTLTDQKLIEFKQALERAGISLPDKWEGFLIAWSRLLELKGADDDQDESSTDEDKDHE